MRDRFGVYWQIVPTVLLDMMADSDRSKAQRVAAAMLTHESNSTSPSSSPHSRARSSPALIVRSAATAGCDPPAVASP